MMDRRHFGGTLLAAITAITAIATAPAARAALLATQKIQDRLPRLKPDPRRWNFREIEAALGGGRLGVAVVDTGRGTVAGHRANERFPMCSTFKWLAAAHVLRRVDDGSESLQRRVAVTQADVVEYAPVAGPHVGGDMTMAEICEAAVTQSDNIAGNLMLASFGGPAGLTRYVRGLGDDVTRFDRNEPSLNEARPGDPRDTTSPAAMAGLLRAHVLGPALSDAGREQITRWLLDCRTGAERLKAGLPADWRIGDKTGTGSLGTSNDVGVIWPAGGGAPIVVATFVTGTRASAEKRNAAIAAVGRMVAAKSAG